MFLTDGLPGRSYDCYVIGAGPAGITLSLELAKANKTVLVFETGTVTEARDDMPNAVNYGHFPDGWWDRHSIRALGGTSRVWSGWCATLMEVDFANPAAGVRWPITKSDLAPHYRRAASVVDREPSILDVETPLIPGFVYRPFSRRAGTRFGRKYREALSTSSLVDVAVGTSVIGLDANASRSAVRALTCFRHASGATEQLDLDPAQNVVVAGGGISNAQLFLQPRADGAVPVGNESGLAGKYLMEHPHLFSVGEVVLDDDLAQQSRPADFGRAAHALVPDDQQMRRHGLLGCSVECRDRTTEHPMAEYLAGEYGRPFHHYVCNVRSEMAPSAGNEVFPDRRARRRRPVPTRRAVRHRRRGLPQRRDDAAPPGGIADRVGEGPRAHQQRTPVPAADRRRSHHGDYPDGDEPVELRGRPGLSGPRIRQPVRGRIVRVPDRRIRESDADDCRARAALGRYAGDGRVIMVNTTRGFSRRTFLLGVGGGAATMSIAWGVSELGLPFLEPGDDSPILATLDAHAEYDGWLVTPEDKARMVLVEFTDGWYARETGGGSSWRWTQQTATLAFLNPRTAAVLHLDYGARADLFEDSPRMLTITVGDQVARSFASDAPGRQQTNVLLPATLLGARDRVEVRIAVDRPFVPANVSPGSEDTRELGIRVYRAAVERAPEPTR